MARVRRREQITAKIMDAWMDGSYHSDTVIKFAWRCEGCGLVWPMRHQAIGCEKRRHEPTYQQGGYARQALRHEAELLSGGRETPERNGA